MTKACSSCLMEKSFDEFYSHSGARDGLRGKCKDCQRAYMRQSHLEHRAERLARKNAHYAANRSRLTERQRLYYSRNTDAVKGYQQRYREANPEKIAALARKRPKANPEIKAVSSRKRRAIKRNAAGSHTVADTRAIFCAQGGRCVYCAADLTSAKRHLDHIQPLARGGSNGPENLQWLCAPCNLSKGAKTHVEFLSYLSVLATGSVRHA